MPEGPTHPRRHAAVHADAIPTTYTTHDELVPEIASFARTLSRRRFTDAFVSSLSTRDLRLRSAFGHYALDGIVESRVQLYFAPYLC